MGILVYSLLWVMQDIYIYIYIFTTFGVRDELQRGLTGTIRLEVGLHGVSRVRNLG